LANTSFRVFISAVTGEFGTFRGEIARVLRRKGHEVCEQEHFRQGPGTLLDKLQDYISQCDAVIFLIGRCCGNFPTPEHAAPFESNPIYGQWRRATRNGRASYTQWEYFLAANSRKHIFTFFASDTYTPDKEVDEPEELRAAQRGYIDWIKQTGKDRESITTLDKLIEDVLVLPLPSIAPKLERRIVPKSLRSFGPEDADYFLELLPDRNDGDTLPESVAFWKRNVECTNQLETFRVGLIYGPSGCGKSSLVRAGILPRLASSIDHVMIAATPDQTEEGILRGLHDKRSKLPRDLGLIESCAWIASSDQGKLLVVIDQFEQWLQAHRGKTRTDLAQALGHCDGRRLQAIVLVRQEFFLEAERFLTELGIVIHKDRNFKVVDLFETAHAERVLARFGRGLRRLPDDVDKMTLSQHRFLSIALEELSQDGRVVSVHLSLFADMMKNKQWAPDVLKGVGGAKGLGVTFLRESFDLQHSDPRFRRHKKAAEKVLEALLPDEGADIKGQMQSATTLRQQSGYADDPRRFDDLVNILDTELRLITPTDPAGMAETVSNRHVSDAQRSIPQTNGTPPSRERFYQLTHDFMVTPLREWLDSELEKTRRGKARKLLTKRAAQYKTDDEKRNPLAWWELICVGLLTNWNAWTPLQKRMIRGAAQWYGVVLAVAVVLLAVVAWFAWEKSGQMQARRLVQGIYSATPAELEKLIRDELTPLRRWANASLGEVANDADAPADQRLRASLAMLPIDNAQIGYLRQRLLDGRVDEFRVSRDALYEHRDKIAPELWTNLRNEEADAQRRFYSGIALASYEPQSESWTNEDASFLATELLNSNPDYQRDLRSYLAPIAARLVSPLEVIFRDPAARDAARDAAATALAEYANDDPAKLAELASVGTPGQHRILFEKLTTSESDRSTIRQTLVTLASEQPPEDFESFGEQQRIEFGRRRAGAAITMLRMGERQSIFDVFRVEEDPESLTQFVHRCKERGVTPMELIECLDVASQVDVRFGLLLALGEFPLEEIPESRRNALVATIADWHAHDPSSGIHGACGWLLRQWGENARADAVDQTPIPYDETGVREWFVHEITVKQSGVSGLLGGKTKLYFTFIVFQPGEFEMGSPQSEADRQNDEALHTVRFSGPIAVSDREVSWTQYSAWDDGQWFGQVSRQFDWIEKDQSACGITWFEAVSYCRWLTETAGMTEDQQCYDDPANLETDNEGNPVDWPLLPGYRQRPGFRLLTEAEWENACRGGSRTRFGFGSDPALLELYGWYVDNAGKRAHRPGDRLPNLRGLFDMHGNLWEWCQDWYTAELQDGAEDPQGEKNGSSRLLRGGGWYLNSDNCRSAYRYIDRPTYRDSDNGFRLCVGVGGQDSRKP